MQLIKTAHIWRALLMCQLVDAVCPIKSTGNHQHYGNVCVCVCVCRGTADCGVRFHSCWIKKKNGFNFISALLLYKGEMPL